MFGAISFKNNTFQCKIFSIILADCKDEIMVIFLFTAYQSYKTCLQRCYQVIVERCDHMTLYSPRRTCNIFDNVVKTLGAPNVCTMFW